MAEEETEENQGGSQGTEVSKDTSSEKTEEEPIPELAPVEEEEAAPAKKKEDTDENQKGSQGTEVSKDTSSEKEESGADDDYKMPTLKEVEEKAEAPEEAPPAPPADVPPAQPAPKESKGEEEERAGPSDDPAGVDPPGPKVEPEQAAPPELTEEDDHIDLDSHDEGDPTCKTCPKCDKDYCAEESFCTNCGAPVAKVRESVSVKEDIPKIKAEASSGNVYKAPALEWHEDEPHTFEVACYNCQNVFDATVEKVPTIINCPQCQAQLQIEEIPPEEDEDDEEDLEITAKEPTIRKVKPPSKGCPKCGGKTRFIPRHFKWFCDSCRQWI